MPTFELNLATMWPGAVGARSLPAILFASATTYQVRGSGAFVKPCTLVEGPAAPSVPVVAVQSRGSKVALMRISTSLSSRAPQSSAAFWKALSRCWPTVVPGLPPTGVAGRRVVESDAGLVGVDDRDARRGRERRRGERAGEEHGGGAERSHGHFGAAAAAGVACGTHVVFVDPSGSVSTRTSKRNASPRSTDFIPSGWVTTSKTGGGCAARDFRRASASARSSSAVGSRSLPVAGSTNARTRAAVRTGAGTSMAGHSSGPAAPAAAESPSSASAASVLPRR